MYKQTTLFYCGSAAQRVRVQSGKASKRRGRVSCSVAGRGGWQAEESLAISPRGGNIHAEVVRKERAWQLGDR